MTSPMYAAPRVSSNVGRICMASTFNEGLGKDWVQYASHCVALYIYSPRDSKSNYPSVASAASAVTA